MSSGLIEAVAAEVQQEIAQDLVGLWSVVRSIQRLDADLKEVELRTALSGVATSLLSGGAGFGQFAQGRGFSRWEAEGSVERMLSEWDELGHDPDIGEIGWFVAGEESG